MKGKYAVRAANKRAFASHASAEELRNDLDAANREVERLSRALAVAERETDQAIERGVREALRDERARMKAAVRENEQAMRRELANADRARLERDAAIVEKLETALKALLARAGELSKGQGFIDMEHALVINEVFEELGVKHASEKLRSILGVKSQGQVAHINGVGRVEVPARVLNRRSAKQVARDSAENRGIENRVPPR